MARTTDTSIQSTGLGRPSLEASSFVQQAPVDTSGIVGSNVTATALGMQAAGIETGAKAINQLAQSIPGIVDAGLEVYKHNALSSLQEAQNAEIDSFLQSQNNPEIAQLAGENAASLDLASHSLWDKLGKGQARIQDLDAVQEAFNKEAETLSNAVKQGVMQPSALRMRLLAITREHVNRNPGLSNELINHAEKVLALSGVSSLQDTKQKLDNSAAKAFEQQKNFLLKEFSKHNVEVDIFQTSNPEYLAEKQDELNKKKRSMAAFNNIVDDEKLRGIKTQQQADQWAKQNGPKLLEGGLARFHVDAQGIMQAFAQDQNAIPGAIRDLANQYIAEAAENVGSAVSLASPEGRVFYDNYVKMISNVAESISQVQTGKDQVEVLNNQVKINSLLNEQKLRSSGINPEAFDFAAKYPEIANKWVINNPEIFDRLLRTTSALVFDGNHMDASLLQSMKSSTAEPGVNDAVSISKNLLTAGRNEEFRKSLAIYKDATKMGNMSQAEVFSFFDSFTDAFSQRFMGEQARKGASKEDVINVNEMAGQYMEFLGRAMDSITQGKNVQAVEVPGVGVTYKVPGDPKLERQLQNDYAGRINRMVKTFANIGNMTQEQAWNFIKIPYAGILKLPQEGGKPNASNPGNIKEVGGQGFQSFSSPQEGIKAIAKQISLYTSGKSQNVSGPTPIPKDFLKIYNNAKEKGSATDGQYATNVARFSGLDLNQPLDQDDMVDLVYGIVKAENVNSPLTRKDVRSAIQGGV